MSIDLESPMNIYADVSREVERILNTLGGVSDDREVSELQSSIRELLTGVQKDLDKRINELKSHSEWDTFTIAFYGETNAGKSTIIETLRILLGERTKVDEQHVFKALQSEHRLTQENLDNARDVIAKGVQLISDLQAQLTTLLRQFDQREAALKGELQRLQDLVVEKQQSASLWQKLMNLFRTLPEEKASADTARQVQVFEAEKAMVTADLTRQQQEAQARKDEAVQAQERLEATLNCLDRLEPLADGGIIGNGRSDFTLATQLYHFESGKQKFALLDVPGIEGDEGKVNEEVWAAVQKAHAVFYVTSKAAAPQKGDEGKKGTLEKIQEHLGSQTEVWSIYNKRVTHPMHLSKDTLIGEDEQGSLNVLDEKMREQLGDHYQRSLPLSAHPAFLGIADCLVPGSSHAKSREKFLGQFSREALLAKSNMLYFHELLTGDFVRDYRNKIRRSNFNKANLLVKHAAEQFASLQRGRLKPLREKLKQDAGDACTQLDICLSGLKSRLDNQVELAIDSFTSSVREEVYDQIDNDIGNDEFKRVFEQALETAQERIKHELPERLKNEFKRFADDIAEVIERFQEFVQELMNAYGKIGIAGLDNKIDLKINIDNGIKVQNLLGALVGGALMFWNPAGWFVLATGAAALLLGIGKALYGFFNSDYKKSQQRKAVDDNLYTIADDIRDSIRANLTQAYPELETRVESIQAVLAEPARQVASINDAVVKSVVELSKLSNTIAAAGIK